VTDIGTGAGIPGVILAIAKPETEFVLIDSTQKKINFINEFANENNLENLKAIAGRAEELEKIKTDLVTSRAVAALPKMLELASNFAKVNGEVILYKGRNIKDEFCPKLKKEIKELGLTYKEIINYKLDDESERSLVIYNKTKENMKGYPRL
jgi:16S rRNA (guanine527-N7)-methyltransferase